jgi:hypothetical protein
MTTFKTLKPCASGGIVSLLGMTESSLFFKDGDAKFEIDLRAPDAPPRPSNFPDNLEAYTPEGGAIEHRVKPGLGYCAFLSPETWEERFVIPDLANRSPDSVLYLQGRLFAVFGLTPCELIDEKWAPIGYLPAPQGIPDSGGPRHVFGRARLADRNVFIWDRNGYELNAEGKLQLTFEAGLEGAYFSTVPWGTDGFYYLSYGKFGRIRRGGKPEELPIGDACFINIRPGPGGSLIAHHARNKNGVAFWVYFPEESSYIAFKKGDLLPGSKDVYLGSALWSPTARRTFFSVPFLSITDEELLSRRRTKIRG